MSNKNEIAYSISTPNLGIEAELVEVKPKAQMTMENAGRSHAKKKQVVINTAKWEAANAYARQHKIRFRVVSEEQLFHQGTRK